MRRSAFKTYHPRLPAPPTPSADTLSVEHRIELLARVPAFASLGATGMRALADAMTEEHAEAGQAILREGDVGTDLYLLAAGRAVVTTASAQGPVVLSQVRPGEMFGELAIFDTERRRRATVSAETPAVLLRLGADAFAGVLASHPSVRTQLEAAREQLLLTRFLKASSPFATVDVALVREMAARLRNISVPAGTVIIRQGEEGETCYLVRSGRVRVLMRDNPDESADPDAATDQGEAAAHPAGAEREIAILLPGMLFGEAALLTGGMRNATVCALENCDLLEIRRSDLLLALGSTAALRAQVSELMHLRDRPRAASGVLVQQYTSRAGETFLTLKNPRTGAYYRLSQQGYFLWQRLDGKHNLRDLALDYLVAFNVFAPQVIAELIASMRAVGFVESGVMMVHASEAGRRSPLARAVAWLRSILEWQVTVPGVDRALGWLYRVGARVLYTLPGQALLGLIALAGMAAFAILTVRDGAQFSHVQFGGWFIVIFGLGYVLNVLAHELGHGLTVKAFGHEVLSGGIGWFWLGPTAFVDTSDLWMASPWPRIATSLAGPYVNLLLGSGAALAAFGHGYGIVQAALWQFAFASYGLVLYNLNPLIEYDGYFILLDLIGMANLKQRSLRWLGSVITAPRTLVSAATLRQHRLYLLYSAGAIVYVVVVAVLIVASYRLVLQAWVAFIIPASVAAVLAWAIALGVVAISAAEIVEGMRSTPSDAHTAG